MGNSKSTCEKHKWKFVFRKDNRRASWCSICGTLKVEELSPSGTIFSRNYSVPKMSKQSNG